MKCLLVPPRWLLFPLFLLTSCLALPALAEDRGEGALDTSQPQGITVEQIIQNFAAKEKQFKIAREQYTYRQDVMVETLEGDTVDGEYRQVVNCGNRFSPSPRCLPTPMSGTFLP